MRNIFFSICVTACIASSPCIADDSPSVAFSAGAFNVFDSDKAMEMDVEYRFAPIAAIWHLRPTLGLAITSDGAYWGQAGIRYEFELNKDWILSPSFAVAAYEQGGGLDLGYDLEFRTGLELARQLDKQQRLGIGIYHFSNSDLGHRNPGAESLLLTYSVSLN